MLSGLQIQLRVIIADGLRHANINATNCLAHCDDALEINHCQIGHGNASELLHGKQRAGGTSLGHGAVDLNKLPCWKIFSAIWIRAGRNRNHQVSRNAQRNNILAVTGNVKHDDHISERRTNWSVVGVALALSGIRADHKHIDRAVYLSWSWKIEAAAVC